MIWDDVLGWNEDALDPAVDALIRIRQRAYTVGEYIQSIDVSSGWSGAGATAAQERRDGLEDSSELVLGLIGDLISGLSAAQHGVAEVRLAVSEALSRASFFGFHISSSGNVSDPCARDPSMTRGEKDEREAAMQTTQTNVWDAVDKAADVDAALKSVLDVVGQGKASQVEDLSDTPGLADSPPVGASTQEVAAWWDALTDAERQRMIKEYPRQLGNLDGIDAWARNEANQHNLNEDLAAVERRIAELEGQFNYKEPKPGEPSDNISYQDPALVTELQDLERQRDDILSIKDALAQGSHTQLLLYEPATGGPGNELTHAAIAVGNMDTADYVATYVPGMTTTAADMPGITKDMRNLRDIAEENCSGGSVATIAWMGYDAPPDVPAAAGLGRAETGGDSLAAFVEGIEDSRNVDGQGSGVYQTVLGHSYGSTTSSYGVSQARPGVVDGYAVFGSPGIVNDSWDMNVPEDNRYMMVFNDDPLYYGNGLVWGEEGLPPGSGLLGKDPFLDDGFTHLNPKDANTTVTGHSGYLVNNSKAQEQLARVVVGTAG
ncbi:alpha/beta hydrolase [Actinobaculum sp. 313]|uniref:alpha/beta hydrolase n=1 Tax=Actinobaculum sp. 313 TaxID=2495645 RepID=UPI000D5286C8|nr:alpha/beta hydrolase [Actinobaculum sp. 313]AWE42579.1 hypothetical protein DDD63_07240 [Actinobaculum sp. 313]